MKMLIICSILLTSCSLFKPNNIETKTVIVQKLVYPQLPTIKAPPKVKMSIVKFDWPRLNNYYSVSNTKECKRQFVEIYHIQTPLSFRIKTDTINGIDNIKQYKTFWDKCSIRSIDLDSNLYIGLTQSEYKKLVTNMNMMVSREKQWRLLLENINSTISEWSENASSLKNE